MPPKAQGVSGTLVLVLLPAVGHHRRSRRQWGPVRAASQEHTRAWWVAAAFTWRAGCRTACCVPALQPERAGHSSFTHTFAAHSLRRQLQAQAGKRGGVPEQGGSPNKHQQW